MCFGEENPTEGEIATSWQTWSDGSGSLPAITGDSDWGKIVLETDDEGRSRVYSFGNSITRQITVTKHRYGSGDGTPSIQIRGHDSTAFAQDDVSPSWEVYSGVIPKTWKYIQIRVIKT